MKIGLFIDTFYPMVDGVIKVVDNYARELTKTDDVTVFCPIINNNDFKDLPYKVVGCPALRIPNVDYELPVPILGQEFRKALKNADLDIVHIHSPFTVGREGLRYAKKKRIPAIISIHSQFDRDIERNVRRNSLFFKIAVNYVTQTYNSVDECFAVNKKTGEHFQTELGLKKNFGVLKNASSILPVKDDKSAYKHEI